MLRLFLRSATLPLSPSPFVGQDVPLFPISPRRISDALPQAQQRRIRVLDDKGQVPASAENASAFYSKFVLIDDCSSEILIFNNYRSAAKRKLCRKIVSQVFNFSTIENASFKVEMTGGAQRPEGRVVDPRFYLNPSFGNCCFCISNISEDVENLSLFQMNIFQNKPGAVGGKILQLPKTMLLPLNVAPVIVPAGPMPRPPGSGVTSPARRNRTRPISRLSPVDIPSRARSFRRLCGT